MALKQRTRWVCKFLIAAALFSSFFSAVSCGSRQDFSSGEGTTAAKIESETTSILDTLPDIDLDGATIRALDRKNSWWQYTEISVEALNGEIINDAIYNRNLRLESECGIKFAVEHADSVGTVIRALILSNDDQYDFIMANMNESTTLAADDMFINLYNIGTLDMENPAWDQNANGYFTISGRLYYGVSDISLGKNEAVWIYMFNKKLVSDYSLESPYQLVRDGGWTFDAVYAMMTAANKDLNGDGIFKAEDDQYGLATHEVNYYGLLIAGGEPLAGVGADGLPQITVGDGRFISVYDKIRDLFGKNNMTAIEYEGKIFIDGRALLCGQVMACVRLFRGMEDDFGVIPLPKYDGEQKNYYTYVIPYDIFSASLPITVGDPERAGSVLQSLAILSDYYITPAYYDITITGKGLRDEESAEMLDIILGSTVYDLARMYDWGGVASGIINNIIQKQEFSAFYAKRENSMKSALEKTLEAFESNVN